MTHSFHQLEEGLELQLDYKKLLKIAEKNLDVIPVVVQDCKTNDVLTLAYVNQVALQESIKTRIATFWSTSRNELWVKGATSGDTLKLIEIRVNCEQNSLLFKVEKQTSGACHTKNAEGQTRATCFYRKVISESQLLF